MAEFFAFVGALSWYAALAIGVCTGLVLMYIRVKTKKKYDELYVSDNEVVQEEQNFTFKEDDAYEVEIYDGKVVGRFNGKDIYEYLILESVNNKTTYTFKTTLPIEVVPFDGENEKVTAFLDTILKDYPEGTKFVITDMAVYIEENVPV